MCGWGWVGGEVLGVDRDHPWHFRLGVDPDTEPTWVTSRLGFQQIHSIVAAAAIHSNKFVLPLTLNVRQGKNKSGFLCFVGN